MFINLDLFRGIHNKRLDTSSLIVRVTSLVSFDVSKYFLSFPVGLIISRRWNTTPPTMPGFHTGNLNFFLNRSALQIKTQTSRLNLQSTRMLMKTHIKLVKNLQVLPSFHSKCFTLRTTQICLPKTFRPSLSRDSKFRKCRLNHWYRVLCSIPNLYMLNLSVL
jgi:hypothetical protein